MESEKIKITKDPDYKKLYYQKNKERIKANTKEYYRRTHDVKTELLTADLNKYHREYQKKQREKIKLYNEHLKTMEK